MIRTRNLLFLLILPVLVGIAWLAWLVFYPLASEQMLLQVSSGDTARMIAAKLKENGIIRSELIFLAVAKLKSTERSLKAGTYSLGGYYSTYGTLELLRKGHTASINITFPEGFSLVQTLRRMEAKGIGSFDELFTASTDTAYVRKLTGFMAPSLEGFLYPETYRVEIGIEPLSMLELMTREFFRQLARENVHPDSIPDFYELLKLAAIVERESAKAEERNLIASVYLNRLKLGMKLESCPTVDYILEARGIKRAVLTYEDINLPSPYNTYQNTGLTPTPICNPSVESILAVLNPAPTNYLFFVSDRKGGNDFSTTFSEHQRKMRLYRE